MAGVFCTFKKLLPESEFIRVHPRLKLLLLLLVGLAMCATFSDTRGYNNAALDLAANWSIHPISE